MEDLNNKLLSAARDGNTDEVVSCLQRGADINHKGHGGRTALHYAAERGHDRSVEVLVEGGGEVNVQDIMGRTALHHAAMEGHDRVVEVLVEGGGKVNVQDNQGLTALHWAAARGHDRSVEVLVEGGGYVDVQDIMECTPLHYAVKQRNTKTAAILVQAGCDKSITDNEGKSPFNYASDEFKEEFELLISRSKATKGSFIPEPIMKMDSRSIGIYKAMLKTGSEKRRDIRIIIVGKKGSGKTSLVKRLLRLKTEVTETNGIDIHKCRIRCNDGAWDSESSDSYHSRLKREFPFKELSEKKVDEKRKSAVKLVATEKRDGTSENNPVLMQSQPESEKDFVVQQDENEVLYDRNIESKIQKMLEAEPTTNEYANVYIWDFAGDEEFYNTHQMFLSKDVIYLVLTNLYESSEVPKSSDQDGAFRFWFKSVHLLCDDHDDDDKKYHRINPPVIVVGTHIDLFEGDQTKSNYMTCYRERLCELEPDLKCHVIYSALISNIDHSEQEINKIRDKIFTAGKETNIWNNKLPIKFILLEEQLDKLKTSKQYLSLKEIKDVAKKTDQPIVEQEQLDLFLRFHHEIGNLIYFRDIQEYIILNPQWLVDTFKCIITADKFPELEYPWIDWKEVTTTGKLDKNTLETILSRQNTHGEVWNYLLKILEKFGIIVRPMRFSENESSIECEDYYVPCLVKTAVPDDIGKKLHENLQEKSSILCFKFSFLSPIIFNQLLISCCRKSEWSVSTLIIDNRRQLAFFRNFAVFDISTNRCTKLVLTKYNNLIQLQIWNFGTQHVSTFDSIRFFVDNKIQQLALERVGTNNRLTVMLKCPKSRFDTDKNMMNYQDMMNDERHEYLCQEHGELQYYTGEWHEVEKAYTSVVINSRVAEVLTIASKSIGRIDANNQIGTCFRVGKDFILTAWHVIEHVADTSNYTRGRPGEHTGNEQDFKSIKVTFDFITNADDNDNSKCFQAETDVVYYNKALDTAILKLKPNTISDFPPPFRHFYCLVPDRDQDNEVYLIGNQNDSQQMNLKVRIWNPTVPRMGSLKSFCANSYKKPSGYEGLDDPNHIVLKCDFRYGASGCPGFVMRGNKLCVVTMFLRGFPTFYYERRFEEERKQFPKEKLFQRGINITAIMDELKKNNFNLYEDIFGNESEIIQ